MFENFEPVYVINLKRREDRKNILLNIFKEKQIKNYTFIEAFDANDDLSNMVYCYPSDNVTKQEMAVMMSHLKAIKFWLENSDSKYGIFLEDDIDFELSKYWKFTWQDFINSLNIDYDILQLSITYIENVHIKNDYSLKLHNKKQYEYAASFYLITRKHAEMIINKYFINKKYNFNYTDSEHIADYNSLFQTKKCYSMPLLAINPNLGTDNKSKPDELEMDESLEKIEQNRIKLVFSSSKRLNDLWSSNLLTLKELLTI